MKKSKFLLTSGLSMSALVLGFSAFCKYEITNRKATIPGKVSNSLRKKSNSQGQEQDDRVDWMRSQTYEIFEITSYDGLKLKGHFLPSEKESDVLVICSHGYRNKGRGEFRYITKYYHDKNYNVLLIDHRASGESEGNIISFGAKESVDILSWLQFAREKFGNDVKIILQGVSMGSASILLVSDNKALLPNVKFMVADCSYSNMYNHFSQTIRLWKIPQINLICVEWLTKTFLGFSFKKLDTMSHLRHSVVPIIFIHGRKDDFIPLNMTYENYDACSSEKDMVIIDNASHGNCYAKGSEKYENKIDEFISKYI